MALVSAPSVLLMDEPFRGLDVESLQAATSMFNALKAKGALMVIASHRKDMLTELCDDYIQLKPHESRKDASKEHTDTETANTE